MKKTLLRTGNNAGRTNVEVSATVFLQRSREFEVRLGLYVTVPHRYYLTVGWSVLRIRPRTIRSFEGFRHPNPPESGPQKWFFSLLNDACRRMSLFLPGPPFQNVNLSGILLCFYYSSLQQVVMGQYFRARSPSQVCFVSVIARLRVTFLSPDKYV